MKRALLIAALIYSGILHAQVLNQDGEGKSSIVYEGGTIGVDFTKARLSFAYNNFGLSQAKQLYRKSPYLWGVSFSGENKEGMAGLFKRGDIATQSQLSGFIGVKINSEDYTVSQNAPIINSIITALAEERKRYDTVADKIKIEKDSTELKKLKKQETVLKANIKEKEKQIKRYDENERRERVTAYFKFGRSGLTFKQVVPATEPTGLSTDFATVNFGGNFAGIGINYETGPFLFGIYAENEKSSTFSTLTKGTYTRTAKETVGPYTQESKEEIIAYKGDYQTYHRINYYADIIFFQAIPAHNYIAWNVYYRYRKSQSEQVMPSYSDLGISTYLFNMKNQFMGGFYVEASDLNQDLEKAKKEPKIRQLKDRLTFGIVTKFSFASIGLPGI